MTSPDGHYGWAPVTQQHTAVGARSRRGTKMITKIKKGILTTEAGRLCRAISGHEHVVFVVKNIILDGLNERYGPAQATTAPAKWYTLLVEYMPLSFSFFFSKSFFLAEATLVSSPPRSSKVLLLCFDPSARQVS